VDTPMEWIDKIVQIEGVESVTPRIYGRYFFTPNENSFLVVGVDLFDEQSSQLLKELLEGIDIKRFLETPNMLIGEGVERFIRGHYYDGEFSFKLSNGEFKRVNIYSTLPSSTNLISNDMIVTPIDLAREIFSIDDEMVTDIALNIPNDSEWDNIIAKLHLLFYDIRVIDKREITKSYKSLYNYRGGLFLILYIITIITFMLILYQRYSMVYSSDRRDIGVLRAIGWSITDILKLKFYETLIIVVSSFIIGVVLAYWYLFVADAPLLQEIFLGGANLANEVEFVPTIEFGVLGSIFLLFAVPFFASVLIPVWKIAVTPPKEAML
jgi:ABC-type lipoprotein release transport system permease subunit